MTFIILKYVVTAAVIVLASEIAKRSDRFGALILALPLMTVVTLFWLYFEKQSDTKIANHAFYTFWYVLPTLPMFLLFPTLLRHFGFPISMSISILGTGVIFVSFAVILDRFGIHLL